MVSQLGGVVEVVRPGWRERLRTWGLAVVAMGATAGVIWAAFTVAAGALGWAAEQHFVTASQAAALEERVEAHAKEREAAAGRRLDRIEGKTDRIIELLVQPQPRRK
jgi:hypothetical protein